MNFDFITDRLAVGTTPILANDVATLLAAKVTHLINCQIEHDDGALLLGSGILYLWNGTEDWNPLERIDKPVRWFQRGVEFALPALCQPHTKLYVHCHMGANRSATMAYAILRAFGLTITQCFTTIDTRRLIAVPGLLECGWWKSADVALRQLGYI